MFFGNLIVKVKKDITGLIKEVKRIILNCQIRALMDNKLEDYMLW